MNYYLSMRLIRAPTQNRLSPTDLFCGRNETELATGCARQPNRRSTTESSLVVVCVWWATRGIPLWHTQTRAIRHTLARRQLLYAMYGLTRIRRYTAECLPCKKIVFVCVSHKQRQRPRRRHCPRANACGVFACITRLSQGIKNNNIRPLQLAIPSSCHMIQLTNAFGVIYICVDSVVMDRVRFRHGGLFVCHKSLSTERIIWNSNIIVSGQPKYILCQCQLPKTVGTSAVKADNRVSELPAARSGKRNPFAIRLCFTITGYLHN